MKNLNIRNALLLLLPPLLAFLVYIPTLSFSFINRDDDAHVYKNHLVLNPLSELTAKEILLTPQLGYPAPVTVGLYRLTFDVFGMNPAYFHFLSLLVHALNVLLAILIMKRLKISTPLILAFGLFFGIHPITAEAVSWVSDLKTLLSTFFMLAAVFYAVGKLETKHIRFYDIFALNALAVLAMGSKASGVVTAVFIFLFFWWVQKKSLIRSWFYSLPAFLAVFLDFAASMIGQSQNGARVLPLEGFDRLSGIWYALSHQLQLLFFLQPPDALHLHTAYPPNQTFLSLAFPVAFISGMLAAYFGFIRKSGSPEAQKFVGLLMAMSLLILLPNIDIIPLTRYLADTYSYAPLAFVAVFAAYCFDRFYERCPSKYFSSLYLKISATGVLLLIFSMMSVATLNTSLNYKNAVFFWSKIEETYPQYFLPCYLVGNALNEMGQFEAAQKKQQDCDVKYPGDYEKALLIKSLQAEKKFEEADKLIQELTKKYVRVDQ